MALAFAIESSAHAMTICPPGTTKTLLLTERLGDGDAGAVDDGELEGDVDGVVDPDGELPGVGEPLGAGGAVLAGAVLAWVTDVGVGVWARCVLVCVWVGCEFAAVGVAVFGVGLTTGTVALAESAEAADADCSLAWAETPAWVITRGVEPATSCPTRLTAVKVTAVTSAHDITQPRASARGRPVQPRSARAKERRWWRGSVGSCVAGTGLVSASPSRH